MSGRLISVEAFSPEEDTLAEQAAAVSDLALREQEWLAYARPITLDNFQSAEVTTASLRRLLDAETMEGYLFRDAATRRALAVGTVVSNICVADPRGNWFKTIKGDQVDEWAALEVNDLEHINIAGKLLDRTKTPQVLAILTDKERERARGIDSLMLPVGNPGRVRVPFWVRREYGLRKLREPAQIYAIDRSGRNPQAVR